MTPAVAQPVAGGFAVPLPYVTEVDWLRNIQAAGPVELQVGGDRYHVRAPRVVPTAQIAAQLSPLYRLAARVYAVPGWLVVDASAADEERPTAVDAETAAPVADVRASAIDGNRVVTGSSPVGGAKDQVRALARRRSKIDSWFIP
jgi:hypothetical protein